MLFRGYFKLYYNYWNNYDKEIKDRVYLLVELGIFMEKVRFLFIYYFLNELVDDLFKY